MTSSKAMGWPGTMTCCQEPSPVATSASVSERPRTWPSGSSSSVTSLPEPLLVAWYGMVTESLPCA
jgi:hypothetical protein